MKKGKMENKKKYERKIRLFFLVIVWILGLIVIMFASLWTMSERENEIIKEGFGDYMMYMVNVTIYCAELNNITYDELLSSYLRDYTDKIIERNYPK